MGPHERSRVELDTSYLKDGRPFVKSEGLEALGLAVLESSSFLGRIATSER